jgi:hypothetical protein
LYHFVKVLPNKTATISVAVFVCYFVCPGSTKLLEIIASRLITVAEPFAAVRDEARRSKPSAVASGAGFSPDASRAARRRKCRLVSNQTFRAKQTGHHCGDRFYCSKILESSKILEISY